MVVGEVKIGQPRDRDVELQRIDAAAHDAIRVTARQNLAQRLDQGRVHVTNAIGLHQVLGLVQVCGVEQRNEFRVRKVIVPGESDEALDRLRRRQVGQMQLFFGFTNIGVSPFQHGQKEIIFAGKVIVDQALVELDALCNSIHPRAAQTVLRKFITRRNQNRLLRSIGIPYAELRELIFAHGGEYNRDDNRLSIAISF